MNNISIVGRLTKDVELQTTSTNVNYIRFGVAVTSDFKTTNGEKQTDFFNCVAWRGTAENIATYFKKGTPIGLIGSMNSRMYDDRNGNKQIIWELNVRNFYFVGSAKEENQNTQSEKPTRKAPTQLADAEDTDLPF